MAYVPPHLRQQKGDRPAAPVLDDENNAGQHTLDEIEKYFWPGDEHDSDETRTTLHGSAENPDKLSYVLLFFEANPRWDKDGIIFTKSNLNLLPAVPQAKEDGEAAKTVTPVPEPAAAGDDLTRPIAVFEQTSRSPYRFGRDFSFAGWYQIDKVALLEPNSPDLVRMLEQKWTVTKKNGRTFKKERDARGWNESLSNRWAVVKLSEDVEALKQRGTPDIKVMEGIEAEPKKNVNEMLAEMRLDGDAKHKSESSKDHDPPEAAQPQADGRNNGSMGD